MTKLPRKIYVHVENEGQGEDEFLEINEAPENITTEQGKRLRVGEYMLQRQVEVLTETRVVAEVG